MSDHPECDRMIAVANESHKLGDFLDWLAENGIHLATVLATKPCLYGSGPWIENIDEFSAKKWRCVHGTIEAHPLSNKAGETDGPCHNCGGTGEVERIDPLLIPHTDSPSHLLARYFGIDLERVEDERRQMLAELAAQS